MEKMSSLGDADGSVMDGGGSVMAAGGSVRADYSVIGAGLAA